MKTIKIIAIIVLLVTALHAIARGQKTDSVRGQLTSNPAIDGWFIGGRFVPDKLVKKRLDGDSVLIYFSPYQYWMFKDLNKNKKVATLHRDTLFVHKPELIKIKEQSSELRYLHWKGKTFRYRYAFYDKAYFYARMKGVSIY